MYIHQPTLWRNTCSEDRVSLEASTLAGRNSWRPGRSEHLHHKAWLKKKKMKLIRRNMMKSDVHTGA